MKLNIAGHRYGSLVVISPTDERSNKSMVWLCRCDCGLIVRAASDQMRAGNKKSCGCQRYVRTAPMNQTHGMCYSRVYKVWDAMIGRCTRPKAARYERYGGRGIKVCERWMKFANFLADMGEPADGMSIDRIANDGDYEPSNCRWATRQEQARNTSRTTFLEIGGIKKPVSVWADEAGIDRAVFAARIRSGWTSDRALTQPIQLKKTSTKFQGSQA
jgi:hypothetical protein